MFWFSSLKAESEWRGGDQKNNGKIGILQALLERSSRQLDINNKTIIVIVVLLVLVLVLVHRR